MHLTSLLMLIRYTQPCCRLECKFAQGSFFAHRRFSFISS
jgi:hypothetical protein